MIPMGLGEGFVLVAERGWEHKGMDPWVSGLPGGESKEGLKE